MSANGSPRQTIRRYSVIGNVLFIAFFGVFGGWAATWEISGAVIASGAFVVESNVKKVQHPTGGVIGEILVREGDTVAAGQVLVRLNETLTKTSLGIVTSQREELIAREARLNAERLGSETVAFPESLKTHGPQSIANEAMDGELRLFQSRRHALEGQRAQLRERITQIKEEIQGLNAQLSAKDKEINYISGELEGLSDLFRKKLVTVTRYNQLQRDEARLNGERGNIVAEIARARARISEAELQIIQLDQNFKTEALKEAREVQSRLSEVKEKVVAAGDQFDRTSIRAPQSGVVHQMSVHTVGGVVGQGETLMLIVPRRDELVLESKVSPGDIDQVDIGAKVHIRVMAGNQRTTPELEGTVEFKAADLTRDRQTDAGHYVVRIVLAKEELGKLGTLKLIPGMPAEAFIQTQARTPLQYIFRPLSDQFARAFRER
jgi:HlyD family secretion protein